MFRDFSATLRCHYYAYAAAAAAFRRLPAG